MAKLGEVPYIGRISVCITRFGTQPGCQNTLEMAVSYSREKLSRAVLSGAECTFSYEEAKLVFDDISRRTGIHFKGMDGYDSLEFYAASMALPKTGLPAGSETSFDVMVSLEDAKSLP